MSCDSIPSTACVVQLGAVTGWWCSWPMANILACLCSCQRRTLGTQFVTINLFSLYLINFMCQTMLDTASVVLRVHYKNMKCDVLFSHGSLSTLFRWGGHFFLKCVKNSSCLQQCKKITKIDRDFPELWSQMYCNCNCNCNWGTCIAPPTRRPRAHHRVNPYPGDRRQNETEMFSDHDETSPSIAAVSAPSAACSMLAVQQQKRLCRQFVEVSAARRGCHTMKRAAQIDLEYWQPMSGLRYNSGVCPRNDMWTSKHNLYWILSATGNQCHSRRAEVRRPRGLRSRTVRSAACRNGASVEAVIQASTTALQ